MENSILNQLSTPLPKEAIEHASKDVTRKGYDTTGYQYQYVVDRLNDVVGLEGWSYSYHLLKEIEGKFGSGQSFWDITVHLTINIGNAARSCAGGHRSAVYGDALKGAITNAFKKTAAFFGVGADAYRGTIDEDYRPIPQETHKTVYLSQDQAEMVTDITNSLISAKNANSAPIKTIVEKVTNGEKIVPVEIVDEMLDYAIEMEGGNIEKAKEYIFRASEFISKKTGEPISAKSLEHLAKSEKWMQSTFRRVKQDYEAFRMQKAQEGK